MSEAVIPAAAAGPARSWRPLVLRVARAAIALLACLGLFSLAAALRGASPIGVYETMIESTLLDWGSAQQVLLRAVPFCLAALAVTIPARAGLVNVGGEGQLIVGAVAAAGVALAAGNGFTGPAAWIAMGLAGGAAGAIWAGIAGLMRVAFGANEAVTTLLLNFIANDLMLYLIYQPWRDADGFGQPQTAPLAADAQLPKLLGSNLNLAVIIAAATVLVVWIVLRRSGWGFALRVVGGNQESARRMGLPVKWLMLSSMLLGGALAGLAGMLNFAGVETQLRPGITLAYGYLAFLASWLGRHSPPKVVAAALLFSAIAVSSNGLQLSYGVDGTIVYILLGLAVIAPLVLAKGRVGGSR